MDNNIEMFADLETFDGPEVFRQMQEKQKEEQSKMLGEKHTMPAAEAVPAVQEEKTADKGKRQNDKPSTQTLQRVRISITESDMNKMRCLLMLPDSSIRKCLREAVSKCIKEQYDKHKKQLKEMLSEK